MHADEPHFPIITHTFSTDILSTGDPFADDQPAHKTQGPAIPNCALPTTFWPPSAHDVPYREIIRHVMILLVKKFSPNGRYLYPKAMKLETVHDCKPRKNLRFSHSKGSTDLISPNTH